VCPSELHLNALHDNRDREKREALKKSENETGVIECIGLFFSDFCRSFAANEFLC